MAVCRKGMVKKMLDTIALIQLAGQGDKCARDTLVEENMGLVYSVAKRFMGRGYELEDLFQIGSIGLIKAIDKFDTSFDVKFSTYAVPLIMGEIKRFLRDDGMVKVSRSLKENGFKVKQAFTLYCQKYGQEPSVEEVAQIVGISKEEVVLSMEANTQVESLQKTTYQSADSELHLEEQLSAQKEGGEGETEKLVNRILLEQLLSNLEEKERKLIWYRYLDDKTQMETARLLHISQVQVSRLEKKILERMRIQAAK